MTTYQALINTSQTGLSLSSANSGHYGAWTMLASLTGVQKLKMVACTPLHYMKFICVSVRINGAPCYVFPSPFQKKADFKSQSLGLRCLIMSPLLTCKMRPGKRRMALFLPSMTGAPLFENRTFMGSTVMRSEVGISTPGRIISTETI